MTARWPIRTLGDVAQINPPRDPSVAADTDVTFLPMSAVAEESGVVDSSGRRLYGDVRRGFRPFREGDVLLAKITPSMENGKSAVARGLAYGHGIGSTEFHVFRTGPELDPDFLRYFLSRRSFRRDARRHMTGTAGQLRVPARYLAETAIALPALAMQQRIVQVVDQQISRHQAAGDALLRSLDRLRLLRWSVLQRAWDHGSSGAEGTGWLSVPLRDLAWDSDYGTSQKATHGADGPPIVRIPNIAGGALELTDLKYATKPGELKAPGALRPGDFLIVRTNGSRDLIGRAALVERDLGRHHFHASYLIRFRLKGDAPLWRWISRIWTSPAVRTQVEAMAATSAGQYNLNQKTLGAVRLPIPPSDRIADQVADLEQRLSRADELASDIKLAIGRLPALREAILMDSIQGTQP